MADESYTLSTTIGNGWGQSYSLSSIGWAYWYRGEPDRAFEVSEAGIELGELAGYNVLQIFNRGQLAVMMAELGDVKRGLAQAHEAVAWAERILPQGMPTVLAIRALLELRELGVETAAATLAQIGTVGREAMLWKMDAILRARSEVALAQGDAGRALAVTQEHVSRVDSLGLKLYVPEARIGLSRAMLRLGRAAEARQQLLQARAAAEAMGARMVVWQVLYALGQVEARDGNVAETGALWNEAREIVNGIAAHTPNSKLHQSFLERPEVRALFAGLPPQAVSRTGVGPNGTP
jgi:tetratricopeptide (TPR) repeat protein